MTAGPPTPWTSGPVGVSEVFWSDGSALHVADDPDRAAPGFPLEPPPGGISVRVIRMPGIPPGTEADETWLRIDGDDADLPGMHATDTLDLMVVLEGSVVLGLDDGERTLSAGDYVVQRGTRHRWRPADHRGLDLPGGDAAPGRRPGRGPPARRAADRRRSATPRSAGSSPAPTPSTAVR